MKHIANKVALATLITSSMALTVALPATANQQTVTVGAGETYSTSTGAVTPTDNTSIDPPVYDPPYNPPTQSTPNNQPSVDDIIREAKNLPDTIEGEIKQEVDNVKSEVENTVDDVVDGAKGYVKDKISGFLGGLLGDILPGFNDTIGQFKSVFEGDAITDFLEEELDFLPGLTSILDKTGNGDFPDPSKVDEALETINLEELYPFMDGSAIAIDSIEKRSNAATEISSKMAGALAHSTTFSDEAQKAMADRVDGSIKAAENSGKLAQDSAGQDVTQNIARNQSEQLSILTGQISGMLIESQQGRVDRAMGTVLSSETLNQLQMINTRADTQQKGAAAHAMQGSAGLQVFGEHQPLVIE